MRQEIKAISRPERVTRKVSDFVSSKTGATVLVLPASVGGVKGIADYTHLIEHDIKKLANAIK